MEEDYYEGIPFGADNLKYWLQRYSLFSKFDEGIQMDKEGWYSVTPEVVAEHIAIRMLEKIGPNAIVVDAMTGVGGNAIQFAIHFQKVIAIDNNLERLHMAKRNAEIYGVSEKIEFINADYFELMQNWRTPVDIIFLSPPWGGPEYLNKEYFDLQTTYPHIPTLLHLSMGICPNIGLYLPRNTDLTQLVEMSGVGSYIEAEDISIDDHKKAITVYFGNLVNFEILYETQNQFEEYHNLNQIENINDCDILDDNNATTNNKRKRRKNRKEKQIKKKRKL